VAAYYIAAKLNANVEDIDFDPDDFLARVNSDLIGKFINVASRSAGFLAKRFEAKIARGRSPLQHSKSWLSTAPCSRSVRASHVWRCNSRSDAMPRRSESVRGQRKAMGARKKKRRGEYADASLGLLGSIQMFRLATIYLKPILPDLAAHVERFLASLHYSGRMPRRFFLKIIVSALTRTS